MARRRLRVHYSSDEEEQEIEEQQQPTETLITPNPNPTNPPPSENVPFEISDEDFVDVPEDFSPPSPQARNDHQSFQGFTAARANPPFASSGSSECRIHGFLCNLGLKLRREWLDSCIFGLTNSVPGFASFDVAEKARLCFEQFLLSDMNCSGGGVLPENVHDMHLVDLPGPFVLQVDEIVNIGCPLRDRYQNAPSGIKRCLKLSMTDGVQRVLGMEYRPIKDLEVLAPAGLKVAICNVNIRHGLLILVPEVLDVLGGLVGDLEAARQRLVLEVNKPPRGKRTRSGVVPSLASRATLAAWTSNGNHGHSSSSASQNTMPSRSSDQATPYAPSGIGSRERIVVEPDVPYSTSHGVNYHGHSNSSTSQSAVPSRPSHQAIPYVASGIGTRERIVQEPDVTFGSNVEFNQSSNAAASVEEINTHDATAAMPEIDTIEVMAEEFADARRRPSAEVNTRDATAAMPEFDTAEMMKEEFAAPSRRSFAEENSHDATAAMPEIDTTEMMVEEFADPSRRPSAEDNPSTHNVSDAVEIDMVDVVEHPHILTGDKEIPFTYLASILANWAVKKDDTLYVQGKIKCFLTGVKGFHFKESPTYKLHVYVDDGSLISEVLIDHNYVQRVIGHSPEEVTAALRSSEISVSKHMKETMLKFQIFLANFEGTMLVEINKSSSLPVALEMEQGCSSSDAWLLLRRLKTFTSPQTRQTTPQRHLPEPIDISP